jgi:hypothetical protein
MLRLLNGQFPLWPKLKILFEYCKYVYFNIQDSNIAEFLVISTETACWEIERKKPKFEVFYLLLYVPLCLGQSPKFKKMWEKFHVFQCFLFLLFTLFVNYEIGKLQFFAGLVKNNKFKFKISFSCTILRFLQFS